LRGSGSVKYYSGNEYTRNKIIFERVGFYAVRVVWKESRELVLPRTCSFKIIEHEDLAVCGSDMRKGGAHSEEGGECRRWVCSGQGDIAVTKGAETTMSLLVLVYLCLLKTSLNEIPWDDA
jgi:hypothetical protein